MPTHCGFVESSRQVTKLLILARNSEGVTSPLCGCRATSEAVGATNAVKVKPLYVSVVPADVITMSADPAVNAGVVMRNTVVAKADAPTTCTAKALTKEELPVCWKRTMLVSACAVTEGEIAGRYFNVI
jgi:hypothetical protein